MKNTNTWLMHFKMNAGQQRINWDTAPDITEPEISIILASMQAWQLGETSEGTQLITTVTRYAAETNDPLYVELMKLFISEEQKHGENLGLYLDAIGRPRVKTNWGDTLFRRARHLFTSMEMWTLAVITVENIAEVYYQTLKEATGCYLLKAICTDILTDEAYHITFQTERLALIYERKHRFSKFFSRQVYWYFYYATVLTVWAAHRKVFRAGGYTFISYLRDMRLKYADTIRKATIFPDYCYA